MTIGIGLLASDGIVIAADSQMTSDIKLWRGKLRGIVSRDVDPRPDGTAIFSHQGGCVVAISGSPAGYAARVAATLIDTFNANKPLVGDELRVVLEEQLRRFHEQNVIPYSTLPRDERPFIQLLIGVHREGASSLWCSDYGVLTDATLYHVIGSGDTQANPLLARLYGLPMPGMIESIFLAAYIVYLTKEVNVYCGKSTDIICLRRDSMLPIPRRFTKQMDQIFDDHADVLFSVGMWTALDYVTPKHKAEALKARRRIKKLGETIRREALFEKRR